MRPVTAAGCARTTYFILFFIIIYFFSLLFRSDGRCRSTAAAGTRHKMKNMKNRQRRPKLHAKHFSLSDIYLYYLLRFPRCFVERKPFITCYILFQIILYTNTFCEIASLSPAINARNL